MSTSNASLSLGVVVSINTGTVTTPVWTPITDVTDISQSSTVKTADVTHLGSSAAGYLPVLLDNGKVTLTFNRNSSDTGQTALVAAFDGLSKVEYKIAAPKNDSQTMAGDTAVFTALVDSYDPWSFSPTKQIVSKATLMISGAVTYTEGS